MNDLERLVEVARRQSRLEWDVSRSRAAHAMVVGRRRRRRTGQVLLGASVAGALLAVIAVRELRPPAPSGPAAASREVALADGSQATLYAGAALDLREHGPEDRLLVEVPRGRVKFTVRPAPRRFRVLAGPVEVTVLGTVFAVERRGAAVWVGVDRGKVAVRWPGGSRILGAAEGALFPPSPAAPLPPPLRAAPPEAPPPRPAPAEAQRPRTPETTAEWKRLAGRKQYAKAFAALDRSAVRDEPGDLLLAADVARLSGHPGEAHRHLERLLARFPSDPRVPTAAFTLGKLRADALGDPRGAAAAFARARAVDRDGPLAPLALAREAESRWRAGERDRARALVEEYRRRYPGGAHLERLNALGAGP